MSTRKPAPLAIHGWTAFAHPLFLAQIEALALQVEALKHRDPVGYEKKNASKRLAAIATTDGLHCTEHTDSYIVQSTAAQVNWNRRREVTTSVNWRYVARTWNRRTDIRGNH